MSRMSNVDSQQEVKIERLEKDVDGVQEQLDTHETECHARHQSIQTRFTEIEMKLKGIIYLGGPVLIAIFVGVAKLVFFT